ELPIADWRLTIEKVAWQLLRLLTPDSCCSCLALVTCHSSLPLRQFGERQHERWAGHEGEARDFGDGLRHMLLAPGFEGHDKGEMAFGQGGFLQHRIDVDAVAGQQGADARQDSGAVADHEAKVSGDDVFRSRSNSGRMPGLVPEGSR